MQLARSPAAIEGRQRGHLAFVCGGWRHFAQRAVHRPVLPRPHIAQPYNGRRHLASLLFLFFICIWVSFSF